MKKIKQILEMTSSINQIKRKTQLKASPMSWIKQKTEYQGLKTRLTNKNIQTVLKKK
jgi:hypothetical protein